MSEVRAIHIGNKTFNVAQASAVKQKSLMLLIGRQIALNSAAGGVDKINVPLLIGALLAQPETTFDEISKIVLEKAFVSGETKPVDIACFHGSMMTLFNLVAEAIAFNLEDFFTWLDSANAARRANQQEAKNQQ